MRIAIESGHGYKGDTYDPGAISQIENNRYEEAAIAYDYALSLRFVLKSHNIESLIIPNQKSNGLNLTQRATYITQNKCTAVVSIHLNSHKNKEANGYETLYRRDDQKSFAETIHQALQRAYPELTNRGIKQQKVMILSPSVPGALIELGFITNQKDIETVAPNDPEQYRTRRILLAKQITSAIIRFFGN
ncbi:MAG: hypothetical protein KatS3mg087_1540 [Patescibacteria group bacterium]|nr:MAG: hypothetical protein KatS3mg087_1540 [Patescibacteria group bacterium]